MGTGLRICGDVCRLVTLLWRLTYRAGRACSFLYGRYVGGGGRERRRLAPPHGRLCTQLFKIFGLVGTPGPGKHVEWEGVERLTHFNHLFPNMRPKVQATNVWEMGWVGVRKEGDG